MKKMSRWGIGPFFASLSLIYGLITILISRYYDPLFKIVFIQRQILEIAGIALIIIGIPFFIISVFTVMKAYNADKLVMKGAFRCCRHPLYASWVVFIVPGIVLLFGNWISLTTPLFMYITLRILVRKEELYLENRFGKEYFNYRNRVPCILPYGIFIKKEIKTKG
jgi:protein-S-isoprenylcysteine O-methyltransferase Ste14